MIRLFDAVFELGIVTWRWHLETESGRVCSLRFRF